MFEKKETVSSKTICTKKRIRRDDEVSIEIRFENVGEGRIESVAGRQLGMDLLLGETELTAKIAR